MDNDQTQQDFAALDPTVIIDSVESLQLESDARIDRKSVV